jgi:tetratricopeptide (TPR) repeat protein
LREEARAHAQLGKFAFKQARFSDALAEFRKAYELAPVPEVLFNIARCQEELGDAPVAARSYAQYLAARPDAPERAELEEHIRELEAREPATPPPAPRVQTPPPVLQISTETVRPRPSRRGLAIGLGVTGAVIVVGVAFGLGFGLSQPAPFHGNISPGFTVINQ